MFSNLLDDLEEWTCLRYMWCLCIIVWAVLFHPEQTSDLVLSSKIVAQALHSSATISVTSHSEGQKSSCKQGVCVWRIWSSGGADHRWALGEIKFLRWDKCWLCGPWHSARIPNGALFSLRECHLLTCFREGLYKHELWGQRLDKECFLLSISLMLFNGSSAVTLSVALCDTKLGAVPVSRCPA